MAGNVSDYKIILCVTLSKGKKINSEINELILSQIIAGEC
jgi:hypothetical protein